jgi:hypothetical protein
MNKENRVVCVDFSLIDMFNSVCFGNVFCPAEDWM